MWHRLTSLWGRIEKTKVGLQVCGILDVEPLPQVIARGLDAADAVRVRSGA